MPPGTSHRRTLLRSMGVGSLLTLAGCTAILDGRDPPDDGGKTGTATDRSPPTDEPVETDEPGAETVDGPVETEEPADGSGAWPTYRYDAANTGTHPETAGVIDDPEERWRFDTGDSVYASPTVVDGRVYVGSYDGNVYAIDAETGEEDRRRDLGSVVETSPTVADGTVHVV